MRQDNSDFAQIGRQLRRWILRSTTEAGSGHPTSSFSAVEVMAGLMFGSVQSAQNLFDDGLRGAKKPFFRFDIAHLDNSANDRLIFSKGHASPLYYALWALAGVIDEEELMSLRKFDSVLEGHPTRRFAFTEVPTGSLGQGLSVGVGMALHARDIAHTDGRVFVLLGDSEMAEGQIAEAMQIAAHYKLRNLVAVVDVNRLGQRGETMVGTDVEVYRSRAEAFGWRSLVVNGHDIAQIAEAYGQAIFGELEDVRPVMIIAQTVKGKGVSFLEDVSGWHGRVLSVAELTEALIEIGEVDDDFAQIVADGIQLAKPQGMGEDLPTKKALRRKLDDSSNQLENYKIGQMIAPRDAYGRVLAELVSRDEQVVVLDAETSNSTRADFAQKVAPERFFEMFIAEQNMVSVAVGLARRGARPFVSTFAAFFTRAADQIRMAQYARVPLVFVGSHCGVSIGADGSSQMGLEDMALFGSLRKSIILYPADATAMKVCVSLASQEAGITYIRSTRGKLPVIYDEEELFEIGGSKELRKIDGASVTIIAAGITVHEALAAAEKLEAEGVSVAVLDCYSVRPIDEDAVVFAASETGKIVVVEDHYAQGGLGDAVARVIALSGRGCQFAHLCVQVEPRSGEPAELMAYAQIDEHAIIDAVMKIAQD